MLSEKKCINYKKTNKENHKGKIIYNKYNSIKEILNDKTEEEKFKNYIKEIFQKKFENFELKELIGKGSESLVYRGLLKNKKKEFSLKMILRKKIDSKYNNELDINKKLKNKNIINCFGYLEIKKNEIDCILMDYAEFGTLRDFQINSLKNHFFSEPLLCFISYQILNGLKYLYLCKICHFDIKPQNIIIDNLLNIKIIDFSVSLDYSKEKSKKIKLPLRGTSVYIAPEVLKNKNIDKKDFDKIDLYSFGVLLFNLAFCSYPFNLNKEDINDYDKMYEKKNKDLVIDNEDNYYSSYFIDFLKKLLEKNINKRMNINEALNHYWIKGAKILYDEKEKTYNATHFLGYLISDHIKNFDDYIKK